MDLVVKGRFPGLMFGHMDEVRACLREPAENSLRVPLRIGPFVMVVVHLSLGDADADRHLVTDFRTHRLEGFENQVRIPMIAATNSNLIAATIPI